VKHGTALYSKSLQAIVVVEFCVSQKTPIANMLSRKTWVIVASVAIAVKMLPG
jgi:ATP/ADP translocase